WMNGQYLMRMPAGEIYEHLVPFLGDDPPPLEAIRLLIEMYKSRGRTLREVAGQMRTFFASDEDVEYEAEAVAKYVKGDDLTTRMTDLMDAFASVEPFDVSTAEQALRGVADSRGLAAGKYIHPLRVALTGKLSSPPIFDVAFALGKERSLRRLQRLIDRLPALLSQ
ncbi:MAG: hypothetical protein ABI837_03510, partial [Acidobacteriota bacterium]